MTTNGTLRVAVFGATGKIGRHVVDRLLAAGHTVTASSENPRPLRPGPARVPGAV